MNYFPASELILNNDGSVYHLALLPEDISNNIITVGDPERVNSIASHFSKILVQKRNREFYTVKGIYNNKEITVISTGIGTDNIDIVLNELNILAKINLKTLEYLSNPRKLSILRIGTSGTLREDIPLGSRLLSEHAIGLEGLMNFYPLEYQASEQKFNKVIKEQLTTSFPFLSPYVVSSSSTINKLFADDFIFGVTATCQGFYHPQGRFLWGKNQESILMCLKGINFEGKVVTNFEMETAGILGLARYFGHEASSVSLILANRTTNEFIQNGEQKMKELIEHCLEKLSSI